MKKSRKRKRKRQVRRSSAMRQRLNPLADKAKLAVRLRLGRSIKHRSLKIEQHTCIEIYRAKQVQRAVLEDGRKVVRKFRNSLELKALRGRLRGDSYKK